MASQLYPAHTIANLWNLTERRIQQLAKDGIIPKADRGKYDLVACTRAYISYLRDRAEGSAGDGASYHEHRSSLTAAKAEREALGLAKLKGEVLPFEDVQLVINEMMAVLTSSMDGLGGRLAGVLAGMTDPAEIRKTILHETRAIRAAAADRLALLGVIDSSGGHSKAPTRKNARSVGRRKKKPAKDKRRARAVA